MVQYLPTFDTTPTIVWSQIHVHISGLPGWFDLYRQWCKNKNQWGW